MKSEYLYLIDNKIDILNNNKIDYSRFLSKIKEYISNRTYTKSEPSLNYKDNSFGKCSPNNLASNCLFYKFLYIIQLNNIKNRLYNEEEKKDEANDIKIKFSDIKNINYEELSFHKIIFEGTYIFDEHINNIIELIKKGVHTLDFSKCDNTNFKFYIDNTTKIYFIYSLILPAKTIKIEKDFCKNIFILEKINFPNTLQNIDDNFMNNCKCLDLDIDLSETNITYTSKNFLSGSTLKNLTLPKSITSIQDNFLNKCYIENDIIINLKELLINKIDNCFCQYIKMDKGKLILPNTVIELGNNFFQNARFKTITFNDKIKNIGDYFLSNSYICDNCKDCDNACTKFNLNLNFEIDSVGKYFLNNSQLYNIKILYIKKIDEYFINNNKYIKNLELKIDNISIGILNLSNVINLKLTIDQKIENKEINEKNIFENFECNDFTFIYLNNTYSSKNDFFNIIFNTYSDSNKYYKYKNKYINLKYKLYNTIL